MTAMDDFPVRHLANSVRILFEWQNIATANVKLILHTQPAGGAWTCSMADLVLIEARKIQNG